MVSEPASIDLRCRAGLRLPPAKFIGSAVGGANDAPPELS